MNDNFKSNQQANNKLVRSENYKYWLGGFFEGEGSVGVGVIVSAGKVVLQLGVTQHISGLNILNSFKTLFLKGSVYLKPGSSNVWVYYLSGIKNIKEIILPFLVSYVLPYSSKYQGNFYNNFSIIIDTMYNNRGKPMDKNTLKDLVRLAYKLNPEGKGKARKRTLEEVLEIIDNQD